MKFSVKVRKSTSGLNLPIANEAFFNSPDVESEIKRVFQMANRRIQNIKNSGVVSPAVKALELAKGKIDRYTVFSFSKNDLLTTQGQEKLSYEWGQAVAFLHNPTSTAMGAKQYRNDLKKTLHVSDKRANEILDYMTDSEIDTIGNIKLMNYRSMIDKYKRDSSDIKNAINWSADNWKSQIMESLRKQSDRMESGINTFLDSFFS